MNLIPYVTLSAKDSSILASPSQSGLVAEGSFSQVSTTQGEVLRSWPEYNLTINLLSPNFFFQYLILNMFTVVIVIGRWIKCLRLARY